MNQPRKLVAANLSAKVWRALSSNPLLTETKKGVSGLLKNVKALNHPFIQLDRGFVFIHVPKTAGTSLRRALRLNPALNLGGHSRALDVMPFIKASYPHVIAIAFVRNPVARFVSLYNYARMEESLYHSARNPEAAPHGKHPDYDLLRDKSLERCAELLIQGKLWYPGVWPSNWHPQVEWLIDRDGKLMVDFIGRVESLPADLQRLNQLHGISTEPIMWLNHSGDKENPPALTDRTLDLLRLYYKRDFEMLGYDENWSPCPPCSGRGNAANQLVSRKS